MKRLRVVSDASALIALSDIGLLDVISPLFAACVVPPAVEQEIAPTVPRPAWVTVMPLTRPIDPRIVAASLDPGEAEALSLALELGGHRIVLDERSARRVGASLGLSVVGTIGISMLARSEALLSDLRPIIESLRATGFFMSEDLVGFALREAGETA